MEKNNLPKYKSYDLPFEERVDDLMHRLTLEEKISQLFNISLEIERLNIPRYDWRNECLHGVAFAENATVFPQAIGMAASWDPDLVYKVACAISTEARAKHHAAIKENKRKRYYGLTFAAPNINIYRDPRWGRGQETFGEDPYLTSQMGIAFVKGLQGSNSKYFKTISEPKHFAVHSGPENFRHKINIIAKDKDLWETYLPAFESCIKIGKAGGIMSAYNRLNNESCSSDYRLLKKILRETWDFEGYIIGDGGAVTDIYSGHKLASNFGEAAARALNGGLNIINPRDIITALKIKKFHSHIMDAINGGILTEQVIDEALKPSLLMRFKLGMFDPPEIVPFTKFSLQVVNNIKYKRLALEMARESIVLLKNENNLLPLNKNVRSIAIIGPNSDNLKALLGDYHGTPREFITPFNGIKNTLSSTKTSLYHAKGCEYFDESDKLFNDAIEIADKAEVIIMNLGLTGEFEGEEGFVLGDLMGDRDTLNLPSVQEKLLEQIHSMGKPIILVLLNGGALSINFAKKNIPAIIEAWYPGEEGGKAIADIIFGNYNPSGKLPITFYKSIEELPDFEDYSMKNRTYRYFNGEPLFPFGFGLSYSHFTYNNLNFSTKTVKKDETLKITVDIQNNSDLIGQEIVQLYLRKKDSSHILPLRELKAFKKISLKPREKREITFLLNSRDYSIVTDEGERIIEVGKFEVSIGGYDSSEEFKGKFLMDEFNIIS